MNRDDNSALIKAPERLQQNVKPGIYKAVCIKNRDPGKIGRIKVVAYQVNGDYHNLNPQALFWAYPANPNYQVPELWARVWIQFEVGSLYSPTYFGRWYASPNGAGTLPHNVEEGSDVPVDAWHYHDLTPEVNIVGRSGEGNSIHLKSKQVNEEHVISSINILDTGGKYLKTKSTHLDTKDFTQESQLPSGNTSLWNLSLPERKAIRDGLQPVADPVAGTIEMGHQNVSKELISTDDVYTVDKTVQNNDDKTPGLDSQLIGGNIIKQRQGAGSIVMMKDAIHMSSPVGVFANLLFTPPMRWDK